MASEKPDLPCAVHWSEGMLLSPQHFQQFDKYISAQDFFWASSLKSEPWGILELGYNRLSFSQGIFKVENLKAVFPDGALFDYRSDYMGDLSLDLSDFRDEMLEGPLLVSVKVPRSTDASLISEDKRYRFDLSTEETDDVMIHNNIAVGRKALNISLGRSEPTSAKYFEVPIAEFSLDGSVFAFTDYHPPAFRLLEDFYLKARFESILLKAREKLVFLSDLLKSTYNEQEELPFNRSFLAFRALCQNLPELEAYSKQNRSPAEIFSLLARLAGSLSFLKDLSVPPIGSEFNFYSLTASFKPHLDVIENSLSEIQKSFQLIDMKVDGNVYSLDLADHQIDQKVLVVIKNQSSLSAVEITNLINQALIGDRGVISDMRRKRTLGAKRSLISKTHVENLGLNNSLDVMEIEFDGSVLTPKSLLEIRFQTEANQSVNFELKLFLKV